MEAQRLRRRYDHRLQRLVHDTGDIQLAVRSGVPPSTARDWARLTAPEVVTLDVAAMSEEVLRREVVRLRRRNAKLYAVLRLVFALLKVTETTLARRRIADGDKRRRLLRAVECSRKTLSLRSALRVLGLSPSRYHCGACGKTFCSTQGTAYYRLQHRRSTFDEVAALSVEAVSKSAIARVKNIGWNSMTRTPAMQGGLTTSRLTFRDVFCTRLLPLPLTRLFYVLPDVDGQRRTMVSVRRQAA